LRPRGILIDRGACAGGTGVGGRDSSLIVRSMISLRGAFGPSPGISVEAAFASSGSVVWSSLLFGDLAVPLISQLVPLDEISFFFLRDGLAWCTSSGWGVEHLFPERGSVITGAVSGRRGTSVVPSRGAEPGSGRVLTEEAVSFRASVFRFSAHGELVPRLLHSTISHQDTRGE